jgi:hypothetical protein
MPVVPSRLHSWVTLMNAAGEPVHLDGSSLPVIVDMVSMCVPLAPMHGVPCYEDAHSATIKDNIDDTPYVRPIRASSQSPFLGCHERITRKVDPRRSGRWRRIQSDLLETANNIVFAVANVFLRSFVPCAPVDVFGG